MPSTYTQNTGIEKPAQGEQSGSWGTTVNTNMDIIDRAINGVTSISLTGTTSTLTTNDGSTSDGQNKLLVLSGTLAATHTITVDPADAQKVYYVHNTSNQTVTFTQGTGAATADVNAGTFSIIYADGSDEVHNLSNSAVASSLKIGGTSVTADADELNTLDGVNSTLEAADLNLLDGSVAGTVVNSTAVVYGSAGEVAATTVDLGDWTITQSGTELHFSHSGTVRFKMTSTGTFKADDDVEAEAF